MSDEGNANRPRPGNASRPGRRGILGRLHDQARQRQDAAPAFDVEKTLRLVRAVRAARTANFWAVLSPAEQADIVSAARKRTYPAGAVLMREGERAGTVMVILEGRTRVSVTEHGRERTVAERGPGDLVGEHGAMPGGVRSATVTAVEPVLALVISTEDFAALTSEHPDVPDLVKQQVYDRLPGSPHGPP